MDMFFVLYVVKIFREMRMISFIRMLRLVQMVDWFVEMVYLYNKIDEDIFFFYV